MIELVLMWNKTGAVEILQSLMIKKIIKKLAISV
jgi:hypothetical protein